MILRQKLVTVILVLLENFIIFKKHIFAVVFGFCSTTQQHLQLLHTFRIYLPFKNVS